MSDIIATVGGAFTHAFNYVWDINTLEAIRMTQPGSVAGGGDASAANQTTEIAALASLLTELQLKADLTETQPTSSKTALTASAPTAASVGVASAQALAANANRKGLTAVNTSSGNISLGFGQAAVLNSGITLTPNGAFEMDEYTFSTAALNAIAAGAASNLAIQEYA